MPDEIHSLNVSHLPNKRRRREFLGVAAAMSLTLCAPSIARSASQALVVPNGGGALQDAMQGAYFGPYQEKNGVQVTGAPYMDAARVKAMVDSHSVDTDIVIIDAGEAEVLARRGLLEPIDYGLLDKASLMAEASHEYYVLLDVAATALAWNTQSVKPDQAPRDWKKFFDPTFNAQRGIQKAASQTLEIAAMGGGQPLEKLYPIDLDLAFKALDGIKKQMTWWTTGAQSAQSLVTGDVDISTIWNGRLFEPRLEGAPVDYTFNQALLDSDAAVIPKGAPNKKLAMSLLAFMLEAKNQAAFARAIPYGPVNTQALAMLDAKTLSLLPNSPQNGKSAVFQNFGYWADNGPMLIDRFNEWLLG
jgi:putative spermidine/putrescine transport system substrate-binding protein